MLFIINFCDLLLQHKIQGWTATKRLETDWQFAKRNCYRLSRVSWALAQISCSHRLHIAFFGIFWINTLYINFKFFTFQKGTFLSETASFKPYRTQKSAEGSDLYVSFWKKVYVQLEKFLRIFSVFAEKPPCADLHEILHKGSSTPRNQPCQILSQSDQGFWFCEWSNFWLSHRKKKSPLTHGLNYRSACDWFWPWVFLALALNMVSSMIKRHDIKS